MSTMLSRALTRLTVTICALALLAALGQPLPNPSRGSKLSASLAALQQLPIGSSLIRRVSDELSGEPSCKADDSASAEMSDAAADALARSALRMRWLLTSPSASGRDWG